MKKKEANSLSVKKKQIKEAVKVLKEYINKWDEGKTSRKKSLLEDTNQTPILLNFTLKKIPELSGIQMIKVPLPHTLITDVTDVCLITGDLDKRDTKADIEPTVQHYKELLSKHGVTSVSEVIPLRQLRTEYKTFESKRNLYGAYDYFLADNKISQCLPRILGKFFFKKRKFPQQINLATSNLKNQIENALSRTVFFLTGRGNSCSAEIAHLELTTQQIIENVEAAINTLAASIPGTWKNINGIYIKTPLSVSIPLYMSSESGNDVELPAPETVEDVEAEELTTLKGYKVKVYRDGNIELVKTDEGSSNSESDHEYSDSMLEKESLDEDGNKRKKIKKLHSGESDCDESDEETEIPSTKNKKIKKKANAGKGKTSVKKQKKKPHSDSFGGGDSDVGLEETETVSTKNKELKKKVNPGKAKALVKKKKRYMDEINDEESEIMTTKKKKRIPK